MRNITVTFDDGSTHVYQNAPDDVTPESIQARAKQDFGKNVTALDGGRNVARTTGATGKWGSGATGVIDLPKKWSAVGADAISNIPSSAANFAGGIVDALSSPIETAKGAWDVGAGGLYNLMPPSVTKFTDRFDYNLPETKRVSETASTVGNMYKNRYGGLENVKENEYVVVMDSDLQDSPNEILRIAEEFKQGFDCIFMRRISRQDGFIKKGAAKVYYKVMSNLSSSSHLDNVGDFYGLSPRAVKSLLQNGERIKYIRGLVSQLGFRTSTIDYDRHARYAGKTNYTITKMFSLAIAGVTGFSITPLLWTVYFAAAGSLISVVLIAYVLWLKLFSDYTIQAGWAFLSVGTLLMSTFALTSLATISLYLGRIVQEVKQRPLFYVDELNERKKHD
jgi:glycosyltransferase involved in cell wall biosynthesis